MDVNVRGGRITKADVTAQIVTVTRELVETNQQKERYVMTDKNILVIDMSKPMVVVPLHEQEEEKLYTEVTMRVLFEDEDEATDLLNALGELEDEGHFPTGANI